MKVGDTFLVNSTDLLKPLIGKIATVTIDGKDVKVRVVQVASGLSEVKVVPDNTKE